MNLWMVFWLCFFAGILAGTLVGNQKNERKTETGERMQVQTDEDSGEWAEIERAYLDVLPWRKQPGNREKLGYLCFQRLKEGGMGWLLGMTVCAAFCFCLLAGYMGFSLGLMITIYTIEQGIMGLPLFFISCFPQMLLYLPAWGILVWQGLEGKAKIRPIPALLAALLLCGGAGLEAYVNPLFL